MLATTVKSGSNEAADRAGGEQCLRCIGSGWEPQRRGAVSCRLCGGSGRAVMEHRAAAESIPFDSGAAEQLHDAGLRQRTTRRLLMLPAETVGGLARPLLRSGAFRAARTIGGFEVSAASSDEELRGWLLRVTQAIDVDADGATAEAIFSAVEFAGQLVDRARTGEPVALLVDAVACFGAGAAVAEQVA